MRTSSTFFIRACAIGVIILMVSAMKPESRGQDSCMIVQCDELGCYVADWACFPDPPSIPIGGCWGCHANAQWHRDVFEKDPRSE